MEVFVQFVYEGKLVETILQDKPLNQETEKLLKWTACNCYIKVYRNSILEMVTKQEL